MVSSINILGSQLKCRFPGPLSRVLGWVWENQWTCILILSPNGSVVHGPHFEKLFQSPHSKCALLGDILLFLTCKNWRQLVRERVLRQFSSSSHCKREQPPASVDRLGFWERVGGTEELVWGCPGEPEQKSLHSWAGRALCGKRRKGSTGKGRVGGHFSLTFGFGLEESWQLSPTKQYVNSYYSISLDFHLH